MWYATAPVIHLQADLRRVLLQRQDAGRHRRPAGVRAAVGPRGILHAVGCDGVRQDVQELALWLRPASAAPCRSSCLALGCAWPCFEQLLHQGGDACCWHHLLGS